MYRVTYRYNGDPRDRPVNPDKCPAGVMVECREAVYRQCRSDKYEGHDWCMRHMHYKDRRREQQLVQSKLKTKSNANRNLRRRVHELEKMLGIKGGE